MNKFFIIFIIILLVPMLAYSQEDFLSEELFFSDLDAEITTAGKQAEKISEIPASAIVITREEIETYGYSSLEEILENIPGLYAINDYGPEGVNFGVRSFWSSVPNDNMIILVNGSNQVNDVYSNYPMTQIAVPVEAIDRIEVVRGPMSVIYGSGAFFGVINIITDEFEESESQSIISASGGSQETYRLFTRVAKRDGDFKYVSNASYYDTKGIDAEYSNMSSNPTTLPGYDAETNSSTDGTLENSEKYFNFSGAYKEFSVDMNYVESEREFYFGFLPIEDGSMNRHATTNFMLEYRKEVSEKLIIDGKLGYYQSREKFVFEQLFPNFYGIQRLESNAYEVELNGFYTPVAHLDITTGVNFRSVLNVSNEFDIPSFGNSALENNQYFVEKENNINTMGFYTQADYEPMENLKFVAGFRLQQMPEYDIKHEQVYLYDYVDESGVPKTEVRFTEREGTYAEDDIEFIPRFAAIYSINEQNVLKLLYGQATNRPSFFQNRQNSLDPTVPDLEPEKIQTYELNYIMALSPKFTSRISLYRNELENLITRVVELDEQGNYKSWSGNAGEMVTNGVEVSVSSKLANGLQLELSGTYQQSEDERPGYEDIDLAYSPNFLGYFKAAYTFQQKYTVALTGNYVDEMETYWEISEQFPEGHRIGETTDPYLNVGANLRLENLLDKNLYLNIRASNLLDEEIHYPTTTTNSWADKGTIGEGLSFLITAGWKF